MKVYEDNSITTALRSVWQVHNVDDKMSSELKAWVKQWILPASLPLPSRPPKKKRRSTRAIFNGVPLDTVAKSLMISSSTLRWRLDKGWSLEDALRTPVRNYRGDKMKFILAGLLTVLLAGSAQAQLPPGGCQELVGQGMICSSPFTFNSNIELTPVVVSALPACNAASKGAVRTVSDATTPTYNGTLTGGGAVTVLVLCNGSAWLSH